MWQDLFSEISQRRVLLYSLLYTFFLVLIAIFAPLLAPYDVSEQNLLLGASSPSFQNILGTDLSLIHI